MELTPSGCAPVDYAALLRRVFPDSQTAAWLLSRDTAPPWKISTDSVRDSFSGYQFIYSRPGVDNICEAFVREWREKGERVCEGAQYQTEDAVSIVAKSGEDEEEDVNVVTENNTGDETKPSEHNNILIPRVSTLVSWGCSENMAFSLHAQVNSTCFLTMIDTSMPFTFLEPGCPAVPGVRHAVAQRTDQGFLFSAYYWLTNGRSILLWIDVPFEETRVGGNGIILLDTYPSSRYPKATDILEMGTGQTLPECANCIMDKARSKQQGKCTCASESLLRHVSAIPDRIRNDPWLFWEWYMLTFQTKLRLTNLVVEHTGKHIKVPLFVLSGFDGRLFDSDCLENNSYFTRYMNIIETEAAHPDIDRKIRIMKRTGSTRRLSIRAITHSFEHDLHPSTALISYALDQTRCTIEDIVDDCRPEKIPPRSSRRDAPFEPTLSRSSMGSDQTFLRKSRIIHNKRKYGDGGPGSSDIIRSESCSFAWESSATMSGTIHLNQRDGQSSSSSQDYGGSRSNLSLSIKFRIPNPSWPWYQAIEAPTQIGFSEMNATVAPIQEADEMNMEEEQDTDPLVSPMLLSIIGRTASAVDKPQQRTVSRERKFACGQCARTFLLAHHLRAHEKLDHGKFILRFPCVDCEMLFVNDSNRRRHVRMIHNKNIKGVELPPAKLFPK